MYVDHQAPAYTTARRVQEVSKSNIPTLIAWAKDDRFTWYVLLPTALLFLQRVISYRDMLQVLTIALMATGHAWRKKSETAVADVYREDR